MWRTKVQEQCALIIKADRTPAVRAVGTGVTGVTGVTGRAAGIVPRWQLVDFGERVESDFILQSVC